MNINVFKGVCVEKRGSRCNASPSRKHPTRYQVQMKCQATNKGEAMRDPIVPQFYASTHESSASPRHFPRARAKLWGGGCKGQCVEVGRGSSLETKEVARKEEDG